MPQEAWELFIEIADRIHEASQFFEPVPPVDDGTTCDFLYNLRRCLLAYVDFGLGSEIYLDSEASYRRKDFLIEFYGLIKSVLDKRRELKLES